MPTNINIKIFMTRKMKTNPPKKVCVFGCFIYANM